VVFKDEPKRPTFTMYLDVLCSVAGRSTLTSYFIGMYYNLARTYTFGMCL